MQTIPAFPEVGIFVVVLCIIISVVVLTIPKRKVTNIIFALSTVSAGIWIAINTILLPLRFADLKTLVSFSFATGFSTLLFIWLFSYHYGNHHVFIKARRVNSTIILSSISFIILSFSDLIITNAHYEDDSLILGYGSLYILGSAFFLLLFFIIAYTLRRKMTLETGRTRSQIQLFFWGFFITAGISLATNLILPPIFNDSNSSRIGPLGMMFFLGSTAYAILRHRFLDIRVLIGRIVYYSLLAILPITTFFFLVIVYTDLFGTVFHPTVYFISIFVGIGFVMLFNKVNEVLRTQVDSRLINPGYNPLETTELLSGDLSLMIELQKINERVMQALTKTIRPDYSAIVLFGNKEHPEVRVYASDGKEINNQAQTLSQATKTLWESMGKHPIVQDEIDIEIEEGIYRNTQNIAKSVKESMLQIGGKVILTLGNKDNLVGMIIIGQKEADSPYTTTDIDFLKSVANTAGLAVERSLLYEEVQQFAATLQEKVDKATAALKKTNGDLEKALGELQEARRVERDMIDVMGHELRTPISIVRNALVMLEHQQGKAETVPKTELEKYLAMALESTRREITLIETLLSATKVDAARMQLYFEKVDFKDVVNDGMEGQKALADKKRIHLSCALPGEEIFVYADRTRIQEIMDNLLSNAIKYTLRGEVKVDIWQDEDFGWISVQDSGIGISDQDLQNLGKKFFRAKQYVPDNGVGEETKVVRPGGTGLGLYVTFDLINVMGGQLYINSKVGEGSKFTFSIPLYKDQKPKQVDQTFDPKTRDSKPHIFINQEVPAQSKQK